MYDGELREKFCQVRSHVSRSKGLRNIFEHQNFQKAYSGTVQMLANKSFWPDIEIAKHVGAPLYQRKKKNIIKDCFEGERGIIPTGNKMEKGKKRIRGQFMCLNCGELGHRKSSCKCPQNGTKKMKRELRKNITKGWFPKMADDGTSQQQEEVMQQEKEVPMSTPSKVARRVVRKITLKKRNDITESSRKNTIKDCFEGERGIIPTGNKVEKGKKRIRGQFMCLNCGELGHRKNSYKCPQNGTKKRKMKPRKSITKGCFPKSADDAATGGGHATRGGGAHIYTT